MRRVRVHRAAVAASLAVLAVPAYAAAHELFDHPPPSGSTAAPPSPAFQSGGPGAKWEMVGTIPTGNPHTDLDFFTRGGETYASVGTLAIGANGGGQTIIKLTEKGAVKPAFVSAAPTATCLSNPAGVTALQHDVEASPKGGTLPHRVEPNRVEQEAKVILDATDASGRCHDQGALGLSGAGRGGLEIIDVTDPANPVEIGMTSHIGEAHTVNVDPKRPHIAYVSSSDSVGVTDNKRVNETSDTSFALDGFEIVDFKSCLDAAGTGGGATPEAKIAERRVACQPKVYRYRFPTLEMQRGHTNKGTVYGCHELEIHPDDRITCGAGQALIVLDMKGAFASDGTVNGSPLPCRRRDSSSVGPFASGAKVADCVMGGTAEAPVDLRVKPWIEKLGAPSVAGVEHVGSVFHQGRENAQGNLAPAFPSAEDIDFDHEAEKSTSGRFAIATDERGGGVTPPGATCSPGADVPMGNGGLHAYSMDRLQKTTPSTAAEAQQAYARTPAGKKAVYRATIRTQPQASVCTAHVFQQIPGQNRIFMAWYSQGTQVVDYVENADGTFEFKEAGYFIPAGSNQWSSGVFKVQENPDGTFTYWGASADFALSGTGRNAIDVYKVTLPRPPGTTRAAGTGSGSSDEDKNNDGIPDSQQRPGTNTSTGSGTTGSGAIGCAATSGFTRAFLSPVRNGLRFDVVPAGGRRATIDVFQQSSGRRVLGERLVARFLQVGKAFSWDGKGTRRPARDGVYAVRVTTKLPDGTTDARRFTVERRSGRFVKRADYFRGERCRTLRTFKLERPVFGGATARSLGIAVRLRTAAQVSVSVLDAKGKVVKRFSTQKLAANKTRRLTLSAKGLKRGSYRVRVTVGGTSDTLTARRL